MRITIGEMAKLCGVSIRTLHHYDRMGLLPPGAVDPETGYRRYGEPEIRRLQQILFWRELDFSLQEIREILSSPDYDAREALGRQRELLELKRQRLDRLLRLIDDNLKGEKTMAFEAFDSRELNEKKDAYAAEARGKWGKTAQWQAYEEREASMTAEKYESRDEGMRDIFRAFAAAVGADPAGAEAQALVKRWHDFIEDNFYPCPKKVLAGLGQMYTCDERFKENLDEYGAGTAQFMSDAIAVYCKE